jgi:N-methylhydantoinase B/oxoprolinase/acetone carboxylase alpha subunit
MEKIKKGIGEGGKTLKQIKEENERLFRETGCYAGITQPYLLRADPIKAELFHSRIMAALISGRETCKMISASPYVREVAELCIGLYTADGDNIIQSTGIQIHIRLMGEHIKWMIENDYEEKVGIEDGDLFITNDPTIANMHPTDVYDILPIFWEGELVGWVCTVIMEMDVGAVSPSCMPSANVERATDGLRFCCEKVGSRDQLRRDFEFHLEHNLDFPDMFLLDRKGAIAANIRVREEVKKLIAEFGIDYYRRATRELIEEERRNQIARIRQRMVPGRYRNVNPVEIYMAEQPVSWLLGKKDVIRLIPIQMNVLPSGHIVLDFEGTGEWGWHSCNVPPKALWGALSITLVQTLSYDGRANLGSLLPFEIKAPPHSLLNPDQVRYLAFSNSWVSVLDTFGIWMGMLGLAYYLRGFREEAFTLRSGSGWQYYGFDQLGRKRAMLIGGPGAMAAGATPVCDGLSGWLATPEVDIGNQEIWELFAPYLCMSRRFHLYCVGYGKYRSGFNITTMDMIHGTQGLFATGAIGCGSDGIIPNVGMLGGYPSGRRITMLLRYRNLPELIANRQPLVHELGDPVEFKRKFPGEVVQFNHMPPPIEVREGDVLAVASSPGGGFGDPLDRDPALVKNDLDNGLATESIARNIYGVVAQFNKETESWTVDYDATQKLREDKRRQRLARGQPVSQWWKKTRERLLSKDLDGKLIEMYQSSMKLSQNFAQEFKEFWQLPEDFSF